MNDNTGMKHVLYLYYIHGQFLRKVLFIILHYPVHLLER